MQTLTAYVCNRLQKYQLIKASWVSQQHITCIKVNEVLLYDDDKHWTEVFFLIVYNDSYTPRAKFYTHVNGNLGHQQLTRYPHKRFRSPQKGDKLDKMWPTSLIFC